MDSIRSDIIPKLLTAGDNIALNRPSSVHEIRKVIFSIDANSIVGLDGFSSMFFEHCWD